MSDLSGLGRRALHKARSAARSRRLSKRLGSARTLPYLGLTPSSLALTGIALAGDVRRVIVALPSLTGRDAFAGIVTCLEVAEVMSRQTRCPVRFLVDDMSGTSRSVRDARRLVESRSAIAPEMYEVVPLERADDDEYTDEDIWVATHWTTAVALDAACRAGRIRPERVVYLIQDYEPDFLAASTQRALARATYRAGFTPLVNSMPVASALATFEGITVGEGAVFAPRLAMRDMENIARSRASARAGTLRVLLYGRPSKPRNMFGIAVAALRIFAAECDALGQSVVFVSAGEAHRPVPLTGRTVMASLGKLDWDAYCRALVEADIVLSLQATPHPSHVPLESALSGAWTVTNDYLDSRTGLHSRLLTAHSDPRALAEQLVHAAGLVASGPRYTFEAAGLDALGSELEVAVAAVLERLQ